MNVEISEELAERIRRFTIGRTIDEQTINRLLTLALRSNYFEWRLHIMPDLQGDWKERLERIAELAGLANPEELCPR